MVDVEADGPAPGMYSMVCFGAIVVDSKLDKVFYGKTAPLPDAVYIKEALAISGFSREEHEAFDQPQVAMHAFFQWLHEVSGGDRIMFVSDNNGFDWQFINWYFWKFCQLNPFGHTSMNLGSLYKGLVRDMHKNFKHLRRTKHTHNPVEDAKGNAEAMLAMMQTIRTQDAAICHRRLR
jgi:hypothetical protein